MKTTTDLHWNRRAETVADDADVNTTDVFQREVELYYISRYLTKDMSILEVGCGNGFTTDRLRSIVSHVDAFDYASAMVDRARETYGETNNRFIHDSVLDPAHIDRDYDAIVCVRVLINLRDLDQQRRALRVLAERLRPGGSLILVEGFRDGFSRLSDLRTKVGLEAVRPAAINFYSQLDDLRPELDRHFSTEETFHLGAYDYLTRIVYPLVARPEEPRHNTVFSERAAELAIAHNPDDLEEMSRVRGFVLRKPA